MKVKDTGEFFRFVVVTLAGLVLDVGIAWLLVSISGMNIALAASISFLLAAAFNYTLHASWTFSSTPMGLARILKYAGLLIALVAVRVAAVSSLALISVLSDSPFAVLLIATGITFSLNYILSRGLVFKVQTSTSSPNNGQ